MTVTTAAATFTKRTDMSTYDPKEFDVEAVKELITAVHADTKDNADALEELQYDLHEIRSHLTYVLGQISERLDELEGQEPDEDYDSDEDEEV